MENNKKTDKLYLPEVTAYTFQKLFSNGKYFVNKFNMQCFCFKQ